jgi:hypothetical protein
MVTDYHFSGFFAAIIKAHHWKEARWPFFALQKTLTGEDAMRLNEGI